MYIKRIIGVFAVILVALMAFTACDTASSSSEASSDTSSAAVKTEVKAYDSAVYGNLPFNINNSGYVAYRDGVTYFRNADKDGAIYSCSMADKKIAAVSEDAKGFSLNTDGQGIYFIEATSGAICFVDYAGSTVKTVYKGETVFVKLYLYSGKLYAVSGSGICVLNTDGTGFTQLYSGVCSYLNIWDGELYFINGDNMICRLEDGQAKVISEIYTTDIVVNNGWIFYIDKNQYSTIYKMKTDGTGVTQINYYASADLCLTPDGVLYYTNLENTYHPTHITVDGADRDYFTQDKAYGLNYVDGYFIYNDMGSGDMRIAKLGTKVPYDLLYTEW